MANENNTPDPTNNQITISLATLDTWLGSEIGRSIVFERERDDHRIRITLSYPDQRFRILTGASFRHALAEAATVALLDF